MRAAVAGLPAATRAERKHLKAGRLADSECWTSSVPTRCTGEIDPATELEWLETTLAANHPVARAHSFGINHPVDIYRPWIG